MTYEYAKKTAGENGLILIYLLREWEEKRSEDIFFEDTKKGFNINLKTEKGIVTALVFWGQLDQPNIRLIMSRQDKYPPFANIKLEDKIRISDELRKADFERTLGNHMNVRLEYDQLPWARLRNVIDSIDSAVNIIKSKC